MTGGQLKNIIVHDEWLSGILGKEAYAVKFNDSFEESLRSGSFFEWLQSVDEDPAFISIKVDTKSIESIQRLEIMGFHLIDTNVRMVATKLHAEPILDPAFSISMAKPTDHEGVVQVANKSFSFSRFHLDPAIPKLIADKSRASWAGNFFKGKRGQHMIVAKSGSHVSGFCQLLETEGNLTIDLIAIEPEHAGKGIGTAIIDFINHNIKYKNIIVGTQLANLPSIGFYQKLGFQLDAAQYVFHYHS